MPLPSAGRAKFEQRERRDELITEKEQIREFTNNNSNDMYTRIDDTQRRGTGNVLSGGRHVNWPSRAHTREPTPLAPELEEAAASFYDEGVRKSFF